MRAGSRRTFLGAMALALLAPGAAVSARAGEGACGDAEAAADLGRELGTLFGDLEAARSLGRHYLASYPDETIGVRLWAQELDRECRRWGTAERLRRALLEGRERDFRGGLVVVVQGWVLARIEARVCALLVELG